MVVHREDALVRRLETLNSETLPAGEVLIEVHYSSLNYKDGLSAAGNPGVTRAFPHAGHRCLRRRSRSAVPEFSAGDDVIVIGFDLGMGTAGASESVSGCPPLGGTTP